MAHTVVVVDTNIIWPSNLLKDKGWSDLTSRAKKWDIRIAVPWVVVEEASNISSRDWWEDGRKKFESLKLSDLGLGGEKGQLRNKIDAAVRRYSDDLCHRLAEICADVVPIPEDVDLENLVMRAIRNRAPYSAKDSDYFRDTLIWLTVCHIAANTPDARVWFVSKNSSDFGDTSEPNPARCPYPLHRDLVDDLEEQQLVGRVFYVRSLERLVQHLAWIHDGIPESEKGRYLSQLDKADFDRTLNAVVRARVVDPASVGLREETTQFVTVGSFTRDPDAVKFFDLALFDDEKGTWSAEFSTPVLATLNVREIVGNDSIERSIEQQPLMIVGGLFVEPDGSVGLVNVDPPKAL
jgi:hypothetical protein